MKRPGEKKSKSLRCNESGKNIDCFSLDGLSFKALYSRKKLQEKEGSWSQCNKRFTCPFLQFCKTGQFLKSFVATSVD